MNRQQFDHAIRAAGAVLGVSELIVIGSQAVHASLTELPEEAERSMEVDIVPPDDPEGLRADVIDGSIGEASMFHETFGYYSQGVSEQTAVLPDGWRDRLVRYESPATMGVVAGAWSSTTCGSPRRSPGVRRTVTSAEPCSKAVVSTCLSSKNDWPRCHTCLPIAVRRSRRSYSRCPLRNRAARDVSTIGVGLEQDSIVYLSPI